MIFLTIPLMGLCVSLVSVFIGLGGGILLVPLLPTLFGLSVHEAVATSLLTIVFVVTENTYKFSKMKVVNWPVVKLMGPFSAIFAVIAARLSQKADGDLILTVLVLLLILVALKTFLTSFSKKEYRPIKDFGVREKILAGGGGALAGLTSGFAGVGAGVILSPVMIFLRLVFPHQLVPTANANMMFTTLAASLTFIFSGHVVKWNQWGLIRWDIALGVFLCAGFFSHFFRPHQNKLPFKIKSLLLAFLLTFLIVKVVLDIF